jgi:hypothetical protein
MLLFNVVVYYIMFSWCCYSMLLFIISCCLMWLFNVVHNRLELTYFVYFSYWINSLWGLFGLAHKGKKDIAFRFIIEYSSLRDFYRPLGNNNNNKSIFIWGFLKDDIFWLVLELEISDYRVMISWRFLVSFRGFCFFKGYIFAWWNIWVSISLSFALTYFLMEMAKAHNPLFVGCCDFSGYMTTWQTLIVLTSEAPT